MALQVSRKGPADFVSNADKAAEQTIYEELHKARPDWGFLMEEGGEIAGDPSKPRFVVESAGWHHPISSTASPISRISIAVEEPRPGGGRGEITQGLVYQPLTDESFWAEKGRGAWLQDRRLRVSARRDLADALVATGIPFKGHGDYPQWRAIAGRGGARGGRYPPSGIGRAGPRLGRGRGATTRSGKGGLKPWDVAAGVLLVREAGGYVSDFRGGDKPFERNEFLASNDGLHTKMHKLVGGALRKG